MGLDSMGTEIYAIHGYFRGLTVGQRTLGFLGCHKLSGSGSMSRWILWPTCHGHHEDMTRCG